MYIIDKYVSAEVSKFFLLVLLASTGIYSTVEFFQKLDNFMEAEVPSFRILNYLLLKLPLIVSQILPISLVLAVIIAFALMNRNNEILALMTSGARLYLLLRPVLVSGIICTVLLFLLSEIVVPITMSKANRIWWFEVKKKSSATSKQKNKWIRDNGSIYHITYYNPQTKTMSGISLNYFNKNFKLIKRIDAKQGVFEAGGWTLHDVMIQELDEKEEIYDVSLYKAINAKIDLVPDDLKRMVKKSEEMNFTELLTYIREIESEGYDATVYRVDFFSKFSLPLVCLIMTLVATGIAVRRSLKESPSISVACGLVMFFLYWVIHSFCLSLGYGGVLPPFFAAWISNILFFFLGLYLLLNIE